MRAPSDKQESFLKRKDMVPIENVGAEGIPPALRQAIDHFKSSPCSTTRERDLEALKKGYSHAKAVLSKELEAGLLKKRDVLLGLLNMHDVFEKAGAEQSRYAKRGETPTPLSCRKLEITPRSSSVALAMGSIATSLYGLENVRVLHTEEIIADSAKTDLECASMEARMVHSDQLLIIDYCSPEDTGSAVEQENMLKLARTIMNVSVDVPTHVAIVPRGAVGMLENVAADQSATPLDSRILQTA